MKTTTVILAGALATSALLMSLSLGAGDSKTAPAPAPAPAPNQTKCPVLGNDIDKSVYVDIDGKRIYVCCPGCIDAIKKNPQKYIKEMESKGIVLDKAK